MKTLLLTAAVIAGLGVAVADAQTAATPQRNPVLSDPGPAPRHRDTRTATQRARDAVRSDKQPPGTENGNQPDRAAAAGGAR